MKRLILVLTLALPACGDTPEKDDNRFEAIRQCIFNRDCNDKDEDICWHKSRKKWICVECVKDGQCDEGGVCIDKECRH